MEKTTIGVHQNELNIINQILRLTQELKLKWHRNDESGIYSSEYKNLKVEIDFYNFQRMDEESSDNTITEISICESQSIPSNKLIFTYSIGTEAFTIINEIVSYTFDDWKESWNRGLKKQFEINRYISEL